MKSRYNKPNSSTFLFFQEAHPQFPENISEELRDFLLRCFARVSSSRPTAEQLLDHPWINPDADTDLDGSKRKRRYRGVRGFEFAKTDLVV
jgi:serine/threonine protein kinase